MRTLRTVTATYGVLTRMLARRGNEPPRPSQMAPIQGKCGSYSAKYGLLCLFRGRPPEAHVAMAAFFGAVLLFLWVRLSCVARLWDFGSAAVPGDRADRP